MKCPLCLDREGNRKNTHYLTDSIIRPCLNLDGGAEREKGVYINMSKTGYVEMNFQRSTNIEELEKLLARQPTEEEIEKAKTNAYAVDNIFCKECEDLFSTIETGFTASILPRFRETDLKGKQVLGLQEVRASRLFWLIQLWRSATCLPNLKVSTDLLDRLRLMILNFKDVRTEKLTAIPISVTYLLTEGEQKVNTQNLIGFILTKNPLVIFMCDFIIQVFDTIDEVQFVELFGLNSKDYKELINHNESVFKVKVISDDERKIVLKNYWAKNAEKRISDYVASIQKIWFELFHTAASPHIIKKFVGEMSANTENNPLFFSKEEVLKRTLHFIEKNKPK